MVRRQGWAGNRQLLLRAADMDTEERMARLQPGQRAREPGAERPRT